jgi:hypothetical protein
MDPPNLNEARFRGFKGRRAVGDPFAQQRCHCIQQQRRFAAEVWDAKGLAVPTLGYGDAALRLKFGACEDDGPSQCFESRCRAVGERGEHSRLDCERHQQKRCFAAEVWDAKGLAVPTLGYEDAAWRLRNGGCETMPLPFARLALSRGGDFSKQCQLGRVGVGDEAFAGGFGYGRLSGGVEFGFLEVFEDFLGSGDD